MQQEEIMNHLHAMRHQLTHDVASLVHSVLQEVKPREPEYAEEIVQLDTANQNGRQLVRLSFPARYINVINTSNVKVYIAGGSPTNQPATAIPVDANVTSAFIMQKNSSITIFQDGVATDGQNTVLLQFSDQPLPMSSNTVTIQQIDVSLSGSNAITHNVVTTGAANTSTPLPNASCNSIRVTALPTNGKYVYVGSASQGVTNASFGDMLRAGDSAVYNVTNADLLAIATDVSGEGISYVITN